MTNDIAADNTNGSGVWSDDEDEQDDLEDFIAEVAREHPEFPAMVEAALQRRRAARARGDDPNDMSEAPETAEETQDQPATPQAKA